MNPVESTVVAATRAYGDIVREIRPLDLTRVPAAARPRAGARRHRLRSWLVPATAAAAVRALAIALVIVRDLPNGRVVPALPSATGSGVPPYYVAVTGPTGWYAYAPLASSPPAVLAIGETLTGKRLATITPPRGSRFVGVTGAADDRTWVVSTMHTSLRASPALSVTWYLLRFTPGAGYTLSKLAIPDSPIDRTSQERMSGMASLLSV